MLRLIVFNLSDDLKIYEHLEKAEVRNPLIKINIIYFN